MTAALEGPGGCRDLATECQETAIELDPDNTGTVLEVQLACAVATQVCYGGVFQPFLDSSDRNPFDVTQDKSIQFAPPYAIGFLNREWVQKRLGVDIAGGKGVNYTSTNPAVLQCKSAPPPPFSAFFIFLRRVGREGGES